MRWVALVMLAGCSLLTVDTRSPSTNNACSDSYAAPVTDSVMAIAITAAAVRAYTTNEHEGDDNGSDPLDFLEPLIIVTTALSSLTFASSASYGYVTVYDCRARKHATRETIAAIARASEGDCSGFSRGLSLDLAEDDREIVMKYSAVVQCLAERHQHGAVREQQAADEAVEAKRAAEADAARRTKEAHERLRLCREQRVRLLLEGRYEMTIPECD